LPTLTRTCPNAERNAAQCVSLPMFPELTAEEVDYTIAKLKEWDAQFGCNAHRGAIAVSAQKSTKSWLSEQESAASTTPSLQE